MSSPPGVVAGASNKALSREEKRRQRRERRQQRLSYAPSGGSRPARPQRWRRTLYEKIADQSPAVWRRSLLVLCAIVGVVGALFGLVALEALTTADWVFSWVSYFAPVDAALLVLGAAVGCGGVVRRHLTIVKVGWVLILIGVMGALIVGVAYLAERNAVDLETDAQNEFRRRDDAFRAHVGSPEALATAVKHDMVVVGWTGIACALVCGGCAFFIFLLRYAYKRHHVGILARYTADNRHSEALARRRAEAEEAAALIGAAYGFDDDERNGEFDAIALESRDDDGVGGNDGITAGSSTGGGKARAPRYETQPDSALVSAGGFVFAPTRIASSERRHERKRAAKEQESLDPDAPTPSSPSTGGGTADGRSRRKGRRKREGRWAERQKARAAALGAASGRDAAAVASPPTRVDVLPG